MSLFPLQKLHLINWEGHADSSLDLHPGVNIIVGKTPLSTDHGKSAILWGMRKVGLDERWDLSKETGWPKFIRRGQDHASVTVHGQGQSVGYHAKKKAQYWTVNDQKYSGAKQPPEAAQLLNLGPANFVRQNTGWFLLPDNTSPGQRARTISEITGMGIINTVVGKARAHASKMAEAKDLAETSLVKAKTEYGLYRGLEVVGTKLQELEVATNEATHTQHRLQELRIAAEKAGQAKSAIDKLEWVTQALALLDQIKAKRARIAEKHQRIEVLGQALIQVQAASAQVVAQPSSDQLSQAQTKLEQLKAMARGLAQNQTRLTQLKLAVSRAKQAMRVWGATKEVGEGLELVELGKAELAHYVGNLARIQALHRAVVRLGEANAAKALADIAYVQVLEERGVAIDGVDHCPICKQVLATIEAKAEVLKEYKKH